MKKHTERVKPQSRKPSNKTLNEEQTKCVYQDFKTLFGILDNAYHDGRDNHDDNAYAILAKAEFYF